jgi:hypothetical protein
MAKQESERSAALAALDVFVGEWAVAVQFPDSPVGRVTFEWALNGQYLLQRSGAPDPVPDSLAIIGPGDASEPYIQHYFDSRGVTRLYRMGLADGVWTLQRTDPDFSPLDFWQRFAGTFSEDNNRIDGRWEQSQDGGATWELDFHLTYTRVQ